MTGYIDVQQHLIPAGYALATATPGSCSPPGRVGGV